MSETIRPKNAEEALDAVKWAMDSQVPMEVAGAGTKRAYGRPAQAATRLDLVGLAGIDLYEPNELVISAAAGTPMAEIEAAHQIHAIEALKASDVFEAPMALRVCEAAKGREEAQRAIEKWYPAALDMFGRSESRRQHEYIRWGLKKRQNGELRRQFIDDVNPLVAKLGLDVPDENKNRRFF